MTKKPRIGLPRGEAELPALYAERVMAAGGNPVAISMADNEAPLEQYARLDGLLLCGGGDIAPQQYGERNGGLARGIDAARDRLELSLTRLALGEGKPILGICRGAQLLNVAAGGVLIQDIASQMPEPLPHARSSQRDRDEEHAIRIKQGSLLAQILQHEPTHGDEALIRVNSSHHQAVRVLADGFRAVAWATDGVIEAIEQDERGRPFVLGVQWHPERLATREPSMQRLFDAFVQACAAGAVRL